LIVSAAVGVFGGWDYSGDGAADGMGGCVDAWLHADCAGARAGSYPRRA